jgi:hypothetical protein
MNTKHYTRWIKLSMMNQRARVCVLRILITKYNILPFSNYNVQIYNFLSKFAARLKPCFGTPVAEHCSRCSKKKHVDRDTTK